MYSSGIPIFSSPSSTNMASFVTCAASSQNELRNANATSDTPRSNTPAALSQSAVQSTVQDLRSLDVHVLSSQLVSSSLPAPPPAYSPPGNQYTPLISASGTIPPHIVSTTVPHLPAPQLTSGQLLITGLPVGWKYLADRRMLQLQERTLQLELELEYK